jgi:shikimate dehydrogenase
LTGYNTDVFGALGTLKVFIAKYDKIIIIGLGGTGQAVFNYLINKYKKKYFLISKKFKLNKKYNNVKLNKSIDKNIIESPALIINCTPLGSNLKKNYINKMPIKKNILFYLNKNSVIFDVIYSPKKTILSKYCQKNKIKYFNGLNMNTTQAKRALQIAFGSKL